MASIFERIADAFKTGDDEVITRVVKTSHIAGSLLDAVGGPENVVSSTNCATRLRLVLKDVSKVDYDAVMKAGAIGVSKPEDEEGGFHIVLGTDKAQYVGDAFKKLIGA